MLKVSCNSHVVTMGSGLINNLTYKEEGSKFFFFEVPLNGNIAGPTFTGFPKFHELSQVRQFELPT